MELDERSIVVDAAIRVSSQWAIPAAYDRSLAIAIAHGAGNDMHSPLLDFIHQSMAEAGMMSVKFNFPYKEQGRRAPDPAHRLMQTWRAVIRALDSEPDLSPAKLVLAGKSLGGRMASMVLAEDNTAQGLVFFGYPLHPPKRTDKLRCRHFDAIRCPMLFIQGTRDPLCDLDLLHEHVIDSHAYARVVHIIEGGDHSFRIPKKMNRTELSVWREIVETLVKWLADVRTTASIDDG